jgi:hypothetical protein
VAVRLDGFAVNLYAYIYGTFVEEDLLTEGMLATIDMPHHFGDVIDFEDPSGFDVD